MTSSVGVRTACSEVSSAVATVLHWAWRSMGALSVASFSGTRSSTVSPAPAKVTSTSPSLTGFPRSSTSPTPGFSPPNLGLSRYCMVDQPVLGSPSIALFT